MDAVDITSLPDLPELESVRSGYPAVGWLMLIYGSLTGLSVAAVIYGVALYGNYLGPAHRMIAYCVIALGFWFFWRLVSNWTRFETSPDGIRLASFFRKRFIPWSAVTEGHFVDRREWGCVSLGLWNRRIKLHLGGLASSSSGYLLAASIYQHLRRQNKIAISEPPEGVARIWLPLPDEIPGRMRWSRKQPRPWYLLLLPASVALAILWFSDPAKSPFGLAMRATLSLLVFGFSLAIIRAARATAYAVDIDEAGFSAETPGGRRHLSWRDVERAELVSAPDRSLMICPEVRGQSVRLPFIFGDRENETMVLAAMRHLRQMPDPIAVWPPVTSITDPEFWHRKANQRQATVYQDAYLRSLQPEVARVVRRARNVAGSSFPLGLFAGCGLALSGLQVSLFRFFYRVPEDGFLLVLDGLVVAVPLGLTCSLVCGVFGDRLGKWIARRYPAEYKELFCSQTSSKASAVFGIVVMILAVLSIPLYYLSYTRLDPVGIASRNVLEPLGSFHRWADTSDVEKTTRQVYHEGHWDERSRYTIRFVGGQKTWRVSDPSVITVFPKGDLDSVLRYAAKKSGKPVKEIAEEPG